jgi:hypothetical protein
MSVLPTDTPLPRPPRCNRGKRIASLILLLGLALPALGGPVQPSKLSLPESVTGEQFDDIPVQASTPAKSIVWIPEGALRGPPWPHPTDPTKTAVHSRVPGKYKLWCIAAMPDPTQPGGVATSVSFVWVTVTGPTPPPTPVPPTPTPSPAPIPAAGLHVLMVYDSNAVGKMPVEQQAVLFAKSVRDYLDAKCVAGADGKTKEWRIWDKDVDATNETALWKTALARPRTAVPWLVVSNGSAGYDGPLPGTVADTLAILKKFGGE